MHIDADALVHELYADQNFALQVQSLFKTPILDEAGRVDRIVLGQVVFGDAIAMQSIEELVHPAVAKLRDKKIKAHSAAKCIVYEAVKLIEAWQSIKCAVVWCVWSEPEIQVRRLMEKRHLSESEARLRLAHQPTLETRRQLLAARTNQVPFVVIENNGTIEELEATVEREWQRLQLDAAP